MTPEAATMTIPMNSSGTSSFRGTRITGSSATPRSNSRIRPVIPTIALAPPIALSSNGGEFLFSKLLDGHFATRLNVVEGDLEFRRAAVTIEAEVVPEPATVVLFAAGFAVAAITGRRRPRIAG